MSTPDISIIVPVYNTEPYLKKCIESIINQSFKNIEIILVDDGSTDNSINILSSYAAMDNRVFLIFEKNQGVSAARNVGMRRAKGEYIMFVDADDWIEIDTCEKAFCAAKSFSADIVIWTYIREYPFHSRETEQFCIKKHTWRGTEKNDVFYQLIGPHGTKIKHPEQIDNQSVVWNKMYKKDKTIRKEFVDTKLIGTEDFLFNVYAFYYADVVTFIPDALYHYRRGNPRSLTHGYSKEFKEKWINLFERVSGFIVQKGLSEDFQKAMQNRICLSFIGLSMRIISANNLTEKEKRDELKMARELPIYSRAFEKLKLNQFPIHWRVYFFFVKHRFCFLLYLLCKMIHAIRNGW